MPGISAGIGLGSRGPSAAWTPRKVVGKVLWLRASSLALANGDAVATWLDESGAGNDATQATVGRRPAYAASAFSGRPAVSFNGSTYLAINSPLVTASVWTIAAVMQVSSLGSPQIALGVGRLGGVALATNANGASKRNMVAKGHSYLDDGTATTSPESWVATRSSGTISLYVGGVAQTLTNATATVDAPETDSAIGAYSTNTSSRWLGKIAEVVISSTAWDGPTIAAWAVYTKRIYGV